MLFYKVEGMLVDITEEPGGNRRAQRENARRISAKSDSFRQKRKDGSFCFVANIAEGVVTAGFIGEEADTVRKTMEAFFRHIDCVLKEMTVEETTIMGIRQLLGRANRFDYIPDDDEILEKYGIGRIIGSPGRGIEYGENVLEIRDKKSIFAAAGQHLLQETFRPELERIYSGSPKSKVVGHPVHYLFRTDDLNLRREACRLLLQALYANGRLRSRRYCYLDFHPGEEFSVQAYDALYHICSGGAILVRYTEGDEREAGGGSGARDTIEQLCQMAKRYSSHVLTVFCLPRECGQLKNMFLENLGDITLVELQEDSAKDAQACAFLKELAKKRHIRTDKQLFSRLKADEGYLASELTELFERWYSHKLKSTVYPQYKNLQVAGEKAIKAAPKGSAYDELQEMVGLTEAKAVIRKALNYYKMQKLYEERGLKRDDPAMHMVFTGNPGTAKTTVARLFARIMKDNGLLSKGQLVEVGRGDLVGRYVGWTAKTVQAKFREARGGVLFIDEAYSLVDDRSGSYGDEAINTIVQEMENRREDVVVIFAGYPKEMEQFLQKNPGLRSRIAFHVPFADYNAEELCRIAQLIGKQKGVFFEDAALEKLRDAFDVASRQSDFGNGRYVRNLLEQAKMNQASRLLEMDFADITTQEIQTLRAEDILLPERKTETRRTIGFAC